jgi:hypothetical protein
VRRPEGRYAEKKLSLESRKYFEDPAQKTEHCLRHNGAPGAWFLTRVL